MSYINVLTSSLIVPVCVCVYKNLQSIMTQALECLHILLCICFILTIDISLAYRIDIIFKTRSMSS